MTPCSCESDLPGWKKPLLTPRKGMGGPGDGSRYDFPDSRIRDRWVDKGRMSPEDADKAMALRSQAGWRSTVDTMQPGQYALSTAVGSVALSARRGDTAWDSYRADASAIELIIDGRRCVEDGDGRWIDAETGRACGAAR